MRIGTFPGSIDPLMMDGLDSDLALYFLVPRGSPEEGWASQFLPAERLLPFELRRDGRPYSEFNTERILLNSNLAKAAGEAKLDGLLITHRGSSAIQRWSKKSNVRIVASSLKWQLRLEDKLWFDDFLKRHDLPRPKSSVWPSHRDSLKSLGDRIVVQVPTSFGSSGTYIIDAEQLPELLAGGLADFGGSCLVRSFVKGSTYGISVFIADRLIALSAMRKQCFWELAHDSTRVPGNPLFSGISWEPSAQFEVAVLRRIENVFLKLGDLLHRDSFRGFAHFDFIIDTDRELFILECNPRLSSATPQLFRFSELLSEVNAASLFLKQAFRKAEKTIPEFIGLPETGFHGSLLDLPAGASGSRVRRTHALGVYAMERGQAVFRTYDMREFGREPRQFLLCSECVEGDRCMAGATIATLISNFPLFDAQGRCNETARGLQQQFDYE